MRLAKLTVAGVLGVTLAAPIAWAETPVAPGQWFISGGYGEYRFEDRDIDDKTGGGQISFGRRIGDWGFELLANKINGANSKSDTPQSRSIDIDQQRIDVLRFIPVSNDNWLPYVAAGLGRISIDSKPRIGEDDESFVNAGVGVMRHINRRLSVRGDLRGVYGFDTEEPEALWSVGIVYALGAAAAAPPPPRVEAPAPAPAIVEAPKDTDGDGVTDDKDQCPDTERGAVVDEKGCYKELTESVTIDLLLEFDYNKADIREEHKAEIKRVADFMRKYPTSRASLEGHTDSRGSDDYNQSLSERRAAAVQQYLVDVEGISAARLSSAGFGESKPKVENDSQENMQRNRRVSAVISGTSTTRVQAQ